MTASVAPLTLSEQLDAMLLGWLERRADRHRPRTPDQRAKAVIAIAATALSEVERFCARWAMTVERDDGVAVIEGPALVVEGFTEITSMSRRY